MAEKRRELDVWIVQSNTVYRKVPYTVVADWIQEGRLLGEDRVRAAGGDKWHVIARVPALAAFLPRPEAFPIEDKAEALEPVASAFDWHQGHAADEEEDVDMIPLIDISLVLLIFFMMTATVSSGLLSAINTPGARRQVEAISKDMYWVGIDRQKGPTGALEKGPDGQPVPIYSVGKDEPALEVRPDLKDQERYLTPDPGQVIAVLAHEVSKDEGKVRIRLRADRDLRVEVVRDMTSRLQRLEAQINRERGGGQQKVSFVILGEVSEPSQQ
jgi:biopolymer transport protein ExbD